MRWIIVILAAGAALAQAPSYEPVGSISQLMIDIIYPSSDALFYIERTPPKTDADWNVIRNQRALLAESGNLLMMRGRARDQGRLGEGLEAHDRRGRQVGLQGGGRQGHGGCAGAGRCAYSVVHSPVIKLTGRTTANR